jgi:galactokinase
MKVPPQLSDLLASDDAVLSSTQRELISKAKTLYQERLAYFAQTHQPPAYVCAAPGRVNIIGEHVDYQNGFVLPMCLDDQYQTICYGTGVLHTTNTTQGSTAPTSIRLRLVSDQANVPEMIEERRFSTDTVTPPPPTKKRHDETTNVEEDEDVEDESTSSSSKWVNYVVGVIVQYLPDIPTTGCVLDLAMAYTSTIPISAGLSSSAALEVVTALFIECILHDGMAFSSSSDTTTTSNTNSNDISVTRALRCQKAEHTWAHSPCGIMDQYVVSCTAADTAVPAEVMLIDCRSLTYTPIRLFKKTSSSSNHNEDEDEDTPLFLITNSMVPHDISNDSQYGLRRTECQDAVRVLQSIPSLNHTIETLRDANMEDLHQGLATNKFKDTNDILYKRAHHVISEIARTTDCAEALQHGLWDKVGCLMNASHTSLRDDYNVSCSEVDLLVDMTQQLNGVYGSRMTGGGFGGCTVTLVRPNYVQSVMESLQRQYYEQTGLQCQCFMTQPGCGAKVLAIDMDCKPESDFFK